MALVILSFAVHVACTMAFNGVPSAVRDADRQRYALVSYCHHEKQKDTIAVALSEAHMAIATAHARLRDLERYVQQELPLPSFEEQEPLLASTFRTYNALVDPTLETFLKAQGPASTYPEDSPGQPDTWNAWTLDRLSAREDTLRQLQKLVGSLGTYRKSLLNVMGGLTSETPERPDIEITCGTEWLMEPHSTPDEQRRSRIRRDQVNRHPAINWPADDGFTTPNPPNEDQPNNPLGFEPPPPIQTVVPDPLLYPNPDNPVYPPAIGRRPIRVWDGRRSVDESKLGSSGRWLLTDEPRTYEERVQKGIQAEIHRGMHPPLTTPLVLFDWRWPDWISSLTTSQRGQLFEADSLEEIRMHSYPANVWNLGDFWEKRLSALLLSTFSRMEALGAPKPGPQAEYEDSLVVTDYEDVVEHAAENPGRQAFDSKHTFMYLMLALYLNTSDWSTGWNRPLEAALHS